MKKRAWIAGVVLAGAAGVTQAADVNFSGYLSVIGGMTLDSGDSLQGYDEDLSFKPDSLAALQMDADLGDGLTATVQFVARGTNDTDVQAEWAYLSYEATDNLTLNAGRIVNPFYMFSQYIDVGYAYTWLRPPTFVYNIAFNASEGINAVYISELSDDWEGTAEFFYGRNTDEVTTQGFTGNQDINKFMILSYAVNNDWLTVRAVYSQADVLIPSPLDALAEGVTALDPVAGANVAIDGDPAKFYGIGFNIDKDDWLIVSEFTRIDFFEQNAFFKTNDSYYIMFGKRMGDLTPYYTYQAQETDAHESPASIANVPLDPNTGATGAQIYASGISESTGHMLGLRYAFHPSAVLTLEYQIEEDDLANTDISLFRFGIDLIF